VTQTEIENAIKTGALLKLGVLAAGETASAADDALAAETLERLMDDLAAAGDAWFDAGHLPEEARHGLTHLLAAALADPFGLPEARTARLAAEAGGARRALRAQGRGAAGDAVRFTDY
jgi:hypothetical protein